LISAQRHTEQAQASSSSSSPYFDLTNNISVIDGKILEDKRCEIYGNSKATTTNSNNSSSNYFPRRIIIVTSRVLIVDLLSNLVPLHQLDGVFLNDLGTGGTNDGFIMRVLKESQARLLIASASKNKSKNSPSAAPTPNLTPTFTPFFTISLTASIQNLLQIKSCSPQSTALSSALNYLQIYPPSPKKNFKLFPRFHAKLAKTLLQTQPLVSECHLQLGPRALEISSILGGLILVVAKELRKCLGISEVAPSSAASTSTSTSTSTPTLSIPALLVTTLQSPQQVMTSPSLDALLKSYLRSTSLPPGGQRTSNLISDLKTLRSLYGSLGELDCVSYWAKLELARKMAARMREYKSMWIVEVGGVALFDKVRERVYTIVKEEVEVEAPTAAGESLLTQSSLALMKTRKIYGPLLKPTH